MFASKKSMREHRNEQSGLHLNSPSRLSLLQSNIPESTINKTQYPMRSVGASFTDFSSRSSPFASALNLPPRLNLSNTPALQSHNLTQNILDCSSCAPLQPTTFPTTHPESSSLSPSQYNFDGLHSVTPSSLSQGISDHEEKCKLLKDLVQIVDKDGNITRTQKMSVSDVYKLRNGDKVLVPVNEFSQPIKAARGLCTRFLTTLLKQPLLCPPDTADFRELKKCSGAKLLKEIHVFFSLPYTDSMNKVLYANLDSGMQNMR